MAENEQEFHADESTTPDGDFKPIEKAESATPGAQYNKNIPGSEGFYVSGEGGNGGPSYNPAEEIMSMPYEDPGRYLPRAIFTEKQLVQDIAIRARLVRMYTGFENPMESMWWRYAGSPGIDGVGRKQFVVIATGDRQVDIAGKSAGWFAGIKDRLGSNNNKLNGE